ncbi:hypothetical protein [uncultured Enterococcus sp.]|uniref:hypothetical protein n=1 Tax=uncultured Enterococcus sp. TaxID=167972 RepID=UPI002AA84E6F|nr:hypothetical protein [uncultured Enterococcus sp.]
MWKDLKLNNVQKIEKVSAEFVIWMHSILPCGKMKIRINDILEQDYPTEQYPNGYTEPSDF